jgi:hypothetical protein
MEDPVLKSPNREAEYMFSKATFPIQFLPNDIFNYLFQFLRSFEIRFFIRCNKGLYSERRDRLPFHLSSILSEKYYYEAEFRMNLLQHIKDPSKQLSLLLRGEIIISSSEPNIIPNLHLFQNLYQLTLCFGVTIDNLNAFNDVMPLNISVIELKFFPSLTILPTAFENLSEIILISCPLLEDIGVLEEVSVIHLENCPLLSDIDCLGKHREAGAVDGNKKSKSKQRQITLRKCPLITSVDHLSEIPSLTLIDCAGIKNIHKLKRIKSLKVEDCGIEDFHLLSASNEIVSLKLYKYDYLSDYSCLQWIEELYFSNVNLSQVKAFQRVRKLSFHQCHELLDGYGLENAYSIIFNDCSKLSDITMLGKVHHLEIHNCSFVHSLKGLGLGNRRVILSSCSTEITDFYHLKSVHEVNISNCKKFCGYSTAYQLTSPDCSLSPTPTPTEISIEKSESEVPALPIPSTPATPNLMLEESSSPSRNRIVRVSNCPSFTLLSDFSSVHHISLRNCVGLKNLNGLKNVYSIEIRSCLALVDIKDLGNNHRVEILACDSINDLSPLQGIPEVIYKDSRTMNANYHCGSGYSTSTSTTPSTCSTPSSSKLHRKEIKHSWN